MGHIGEELALGPGGLLGLLTGLFQRLQLLAGQLEILGKNHEEGGQQHGAAQHRRTGPLLA